MTNEVELNESTTNPGSRSGAQGHAPAPHSAPYSGSESLPRTSPGVRFPFDLGKNLLTGRWFMGVALLSTLILSTLALASLDLAPLEAQAVTNPDPLPVVAAETTVSDSAINLTRTDAPEPQLNIADEPREERIPVTIRQGDTLMDALLRNGADRRDAYNAIEALSDHINPRKIQVGQTFDMVMREVAGTTTLETLTVANRFASEVIVARSEAGTYASAEKTLTVDDIAMVQDGTIDDSLYLAAMRAGVPVDVLVGFIRIFSYDVDFQREIRKGDSFALSYQRRINVATGAVENGDILYGRMTLRGKDIELYRLEPEGGGPEEYFKPDGKSSRKLLMKTPVDGARLTSRFGSRKHPVLGYTRMHKGLDFGTGHGAPIMAAGNGTIERASRYGSFGNYIRIRHANGYKTAYAHLSKYGRGIKAGKHVTQGQIIGYTGATGRVTGAHLHYEVFKDGKQVNPLKLNFPTGRTLKGAEKARFDGIVTARNATIDRIVWAHRRLALAALPEAAAADRTPQGTAASTSSRP